MAGLNSIALRRFAVLPPGEFCKHQIRLPYREHIRRCHIPAGFIKSLICNRCHEGFLFSDLLVQHQRQEDPCPITEPEIVPGKVTLEQAARLTATKRKRPHMNDDMRWFEFYDIIFPGQDPAHRPLTPCTIDHFLFSFFFFFFRI